MEGLLGKTLGNKYRIDQLLGKGGMGAVYKARDVALNHDVAVKVMHPYLTDDDSFRARFLQEARAVAALDHPAIVEVHTFDEDLGMLYFVMDFIPGQSLHSWLRQLADERKIISLTESLELIRQLALALHYAHEKGVLHRDIKPANILLKPVDPALREPGDLPFQPVLTDFGLAKLAEGGVQTRTGTTMGTPTYMSPEQCLGLEPDRRSDIYSLGIVLYELTTGRVPFEVKSLTEAIRRHTQEAPPPPRSINPTLPVEVENMILRALAKEREDRFATAREMADAIREARSRIPENLTVTPTVSAERTETTDQGPTGYVSLMTRMAEESVGPAVPGTEAWEAAGPASQPGASIVVVSPDGQSRRVPVGEKQILTVGRVSGNDIQLPDAGASRHHARIECTAQSCTVTDLNSTNGTFLGDSRLLPGVSQPWPAGVPLRIGRHWLRFEAEAARPGAPSVLGPPSRFQATASRRKQAAPPTVVLEPNALTVDAGQRTVTQLRIVNQGTQVDHFAVGVDGIPPSWVSLPREPLRLTPNEGGTVSVSLHPPREPRSTAGPHPFSLRVISQADPRQTAQISGTLNVNPFHEFSAQMAPQQITTGQARVTVANQGNTPTHLTISATDPAEALQVRASPSQLALNPGREQVVPLEAKTKQRRPWFGATQRHPFELAVTSSQGEALRQGGTLIVKPIIPTWVLPVLGVVLMLLCAGGAAAYTAYNNNLKATATAQTATAIVAVTLTAGTDSDGDGLTDIREQQLGTDPLKYDTDGDGLGDQEELDYKTKPLITDSDGDGLSDGDEVAYGANPLAVDSDGDTLPDGKEVHELGTSPINPDTDGDGTNDNVDPDPGQLPTLTPTPTFTPTPTDTPTATATPTGTYTPAPTDTPTPTHTPMPTDSPTPTSGPTTPPVVITRINPGVITLVPFPVTRPVVIGTLPVFRIQQRVAYIYNTDKNSAEAYQQLIQEKLSLVSVDLIPLSNLVSQDLTKYAGIIVGWDTGSGSSWGNANQLNKIKDSGKPVLGIGDGGYALFGELGADIGYPNGAHGSQQELYVANPSHKVFTSPNAISVPASQRLKVYNSNVNTVLILGSKLPGNVERLGQQVANNDYSVLLHQPDRYTLWAFGGPATGLTSSGGDLFANVLSYSIWG